MTNYSSPQVGRYNMTLFIILMLLLLMLIYGLSLGFQSRSTRFLFECYNRNGLCLCLFLAGVITSAIRTDSSGVIPRSHYNLYHDNMVQYWNLNGSYILWNMKVINCNALTSAFQYLMHCPFPTPPRALLSSGYLNGDEVEWAVTQRRKHLPSGIHLFISLIKSV